MSTITSSVPVAKTKSKTVKQILDEASAAAEALILRDVFLKLVMKATPGLDPAVPKATVKDPKVAALEIAIASGSWQSSGTLRREIAGLFEILMGTKLDLSLPQVGLRAFLLAVPLTNNVSHDYPLGSVVMFYTSGNNNALNIRKGVLVVGNSLEHQMLGNGTHFRFPTQAEAEEFVTKCLATPENIKRLRDHVGGKLDAALQSAS